MRVCNGVHACRHACRRAKYEHGYLKNSQGHWCGPAAGKFYELYADDAQVGHDVLNWKLTVTGVGHCLQVRTSSWSFVMHVKWITSVCCTTCMPRRKVYAVSVLILNLGKYFCSKYGGNAYNDMVWQCMPCVLTCTLRDHSQSQSALNMGVFVVEGGLPGERDR